MEPAGPKYMQIRKSEYLQEKGFEIHTSFWKQCQSVVAVKILKRQLISFSTVLIIPMKD